MFKLSLNRIQQRARIDCGLEPSANKQTLCHSNRRGSAIIHSASDSGARLDSRNGSRAVPPGCGTSRCGSAGQKRQWIQYTTTERIDSPACMRSNPELMSLSDSV